MSVLIVMCQGLACKAYLSILVHPFLPKQLCTFGQDRIKYANDRTRECLLA